MPLLLSRCPLFHSDEKRENLIARTIPLHLVPSSDEMNEGKGIETDLSFVGAGGAIFTAVSKIIREERSEPILIFIGSYVVITSVVITGIGR